MALEKLFRSVFRNKGLTLIHISGLALGLAAAMFLLVYLRFEFSYDTHFKDSDRIYRMLTQWDDPGRDPDISPFNIRKLGLAMRAEIPEIETVARLMNCYRIGYQYENGEKVDVSTYMVDSTFLHIFDFPLLYGNPLTALNEPGKCVITRRTAERFFGAGVNPVGKTLVNENYRSDPDWKSLAVLEVAAVIENVPANTHLQFDLLTKLIEFPGLGGCEYGTYFKLRKGVDVKKALEKCDALNFRLLEASFSGERFLCMSEPLRSIHLSTRAGRDLTPSVNRTNLLFIILVTFFILGIAVCNFISLSVVQGEDRALEISVRKTSGAGRKSIARMLFGESFLVTGIAFLLAVILYRLCSEYLAERLGFNLPREEMGRMAWGWFAVLFLGVSFIVGGYPAYYLSRFRPCELIRNTVVRRYRLTVASVVVQFIVVIFCVASWGVLRKQMSFVENLPLGYEPKHTLTVSLPESSLTQTALQELSRYPGIDTVAFGSAPLSMYGSQLTYKQGRTAKEGVLVDRQAVGVGYMKLFRIPIVAGRDFYEDIRLDSASVILSESAAKALDLGEDPIGEKIILWRRPYTVVGIAGDIYYNSLHKKRGDLIYVAVNFLSRLSVRFEPGKYLAAREALAGFLKPRLGEQPVSVQLVDDLIKYQYRQDQITGRILTSGTLLAIVLALLGLGALMGFVARQKRKEIGIRRVLGAQVSEIVFDLNRYVIVRILPAVPFGIALSYYVMSRWLTNFAYTVSLDGWLFAWALFLTLGLVVFTLFYQSMRAALANPADALKSE